MAAYSTPRGILPMLFAAILILQVTLASQHGFPHRPHHVHRPASEIMEAHVEEYSSLLKEKRANNIDIHGVAGPTPRPRLEIRELKKNADQWNLYLLGLEKFYARPKTDRMSYYQIAGVHGRPYQSWNNFPTPLLNTAGFCPHAQTLFGSWHRPYLAIFEQAWYDCVQEVVRSFPANQQQRWKNAASTMRMPYWDWAMYPGSNQPAVPTLLRDKTVTVTKPSGQVTIPNPLYSYSWGSSLPSEMGGGPYGNFPTTLRRPVANPSRSNNNELNSRFASMRVSLRDRLYALFLTKQSWGYVSTSAFGVRTSKSGNNPDSFESVHDAVHATTGGETGGHMYYLDYSAFEPIFWLHHTNIDRLLAMYQLVAPNTWVARGTVNRGTAQWSAGESKDGNSPLKPFTKTESGDYFTSNDVKSTRILGYYYPETSSGATAQSVLNAVTRLYGPNAAVSKKRSTGQYEGRPFREGDYQTVLSIQAHKYALDGSYTIHCFLGSGGNSTNVTVPYPTNSTSPSLNSTSPSLNSTDDFTQDPNYVGMYAVLGGSHADKNSSYPVMTEGCIPLTTALQGKEATGELKSLHPDHVESYLAENLHYKVIGPGNVEIPADQIPGLHFYSKACPVNPSGPDGFPEFGDYILLPRATKNKPAGGNPSYTPTPLDYVTPGPGEENPQPSQPEMPYPSGTSPAYPTGTMAFPYPLSPPEQEEGYCISKQTIEYVDQEGNFLYSEMT